MESEPRRPEWCRLTTVTPRPRLFSELPAKAEEPLLLKSPPGRGRSPVQENARQPARAHGHGARGRRPDSRLTERLIDRIFRTLQAILGEVAVVAATARLPCPASRRPFWLGRSPAPIAHERAKSPPARHRSAPPAHSYSGPRSHDLDDARSRARQSCSRRSSSFTFCLFRARRRVDRLVSSEAAAFRTFKGCPLPPDRDRSRRPGRSSSRQADLIGVGEPVFLPRDRATPTPWSMPKLPI